MIGCSALAVLKLLFGSRPLCRDGLSKNEVMDIEPIQEFAICGADRIAPLQGLSRMLKKHEETCQGA